LDLKWAFGDIEWFKLAANCIHGLDILSVCAIVGLFRPAIIQGDIEINTIFVGSFNIVSSFNGGSSHSSSPGLTRRPSSWTLGNSFNGGSSYIIWPGPAPTALPLTFRSCAWH
jgi:hypothetical protein